MLCRTVREEIGDCTRCRLHAGRKNIVFGAGNPDARLVFVGEGPGEEEDLQAEPFVGKAGQLLTRMIQAIQLDRSDVYIANMVKCRPPGNRDPQEDEIETCLPFLMKQLAVIQPRIICTLGRFSTQALLGTKEGITKLRGRFHELGKRHQGDAHLSPLISAALPGEKNGRRGRICRRCRRNIRRDRNRHFNV